jgi:hypothetical protein
MTFYLPYQTRVVSVNPLRQNTKLNSKFATFAACLHFLNQNPYSRI